MFCFILLLFSCYTSVLFCFIFSIILFWFFPLFVLFVLFCFDLFFILFCLYVLFWLAFTHFEFALSFVSSLLCNCFCGKKIENTGFTFQSVLCYVVCARKKAAKMTVLQLSVTFFVKSRVFALGFDWVDYVLLWATVLYPLTFIFFFFFKIIEILQSKKFS